MKPIIYQLLPRLFGNDNPARIAGGGMEQNGCGKLSDINRRALDALRQFGVTHVWLTGVIEHARAADRLSEKGTVDAPCLVKGKAGSPYAIKDYYAVHPTLCSGGKEDAPLENLLRLAHRRGLKVLIDFVPNHVFRRYRSAAKPAGVKDPGTRDNRQQAFSPQNNFYYIPNQRFRCPQETAAGNRRYSEKPAKATGNDCFVANPTTDDWYETVKLNYGVDYCGGGAKHFHPTPDTWKKMLHILLFWAGKGVDGFRCDMVEMVPCAFWEWAVSQVKAQYPAVCFIGEIYNPAACRAYLFEGGFDYLYDKVGLYDTLRAVVRGEKPAADITHTWQAIDGLQDRMLHFLENHDEQRLASDFFAGDARKGKPALLVSALMSRAPFMLYFGQELGERGMDAEGFSGRDGRTSIFDYWSLDKLIRWRAGGTYDGSRLTPEEKALQAFYQRVFEITREEAVAQGGFYDLMYVNAVAGVHFNPHRHYAFYRYRKEEVVLVIANFGDEAFACRLNVPQDAFQRFCFPEGEALAINLLTGEAWGMLIRSGVPLAFDVPACGGVVIKLTRRTGNGNTACLRNI